MAIVRRSELLAADVRKGRIDERRFALWVALANVLGAGAAELAVRDTGITVHALGEVACAQDGEAKTATAFLLTSLGKTYHNATPRGDQDAAMLEAFTMAVDRLDRASEMGLEGRDPNLGALLWIGTDAREVTPVGAH